MVFKLYRHNDLKKERVLQIDATCNDVGCGAVLLQEYEDDICQ